MIQRLSHVTVYVGDQDEALAFYRDKLDFEVHDDVSLEGGFRWLTVSPKGQPDMQIVLFAAPPELLPLIEKGALGVGVLETDDLRADYERLSKQGVEFKSPPREQFYGFEAVMKDDSGNYFSLTQRER